MAESQGPHTNNSVAIIGLGYVGLPLAREAVSAGYRVIGFDINPAMVDTLNAGQSHVDDISDSEIQAMIAGGFWATTDHGRLEEADVFVICVPTPLSDDGGPDLSAVRDAAEAVAAHLQPHALVVLESTTYPGTTDEEVRPLLEQFGRVAGQDFHLAFSPERIDPGNKDFGPRNTPKIVGGHTSACTEAAVRFYERFVEEVVRARGTREAEMAKLLENTYRHVNIALVNEMARFCYDLKVDLWDVVNLAATKPFGFQAFRPGPGVGGHCIPIDPNYLSHSVRTRLGYQFRFVELAQEINAGMPAYVARRAQDFLNDGYKPLKGATVLLLGVTYKPNIADTRESPAVPLARILTERGAVVRYQDPHIKTWKFDRRVLQREEDLEQALYEADLAILLQDHRAYDFDSIAASGTAVLDTRGVLPTNRNVVRL